MTKKGFTRLFIHKSLIAVLLLLLFVAALGAGMKYGTGSVSNLSLAHKAAGESAGRSRSPYRIPESDLWQDVNRATLTGYSLASTPFARTYRTLKLNRQMLLTRLNQAPMEASSATSETLLPLPLPDGHWANFRLEESPVLPATLAAKYPTIKSYRGEAIEKPGALLRCDWSPRGLHATILWQNQWISLHPLAYDEADYYVSYYGSQVTEATEGLSCQVDESRHLRSHRQVESATAENFPVGSVRRTYRLALATTVEYTNNAMLGGGSVATTMASLNTWVNALNVLYEQELSVRFVLAENTDQAIFTTEPDGLTAGDNGKMVEEIRPILESKLGLGKYDLGQVLSPGRGGQAYVGVVCESDNYKGGGVTLTPASQAVGTGYGLIILAHEIGHQFNARHTFSDTLHPLCNSAQFTANTAFEAFGGMTIMSYAEACTPIVWFTAPLFHSGSFAQVSAYLNNANGGASCAVVSNTGNQTPTISAGSNYTIPRGTPFRLTASGSDPDVSDLPNLTYSWEQLDAGTRPASVDGSVGPLFRPFLPTGNPTRTFPSLTYILNYANVPPDELLGLKTAETLPDVARAMNFRCTVRDGRGGVNNASALITVADAGPFLVTAPHTAASWIGGTTQAVTWSVNNTNAAPINCQNVKISLSLDGGNSFPYVLATSVPNTGVANVNVPAGNGSTQARIKVEAVNNIFFDVSDVDFALVPALEADVAPRPNSNGTVSIADWAQVGRFVVGLDTPAAGSEFQRADCAPRATVGDGKLTITDWVQAGRYAAGLDPATPAAGAAMLASSLLVAPQQQQAESTRIVRAENTLMLRGQVNSLPVRCNALGDENAWGFSISFDSKLLSFYRATAAAGLTLAINTKAASNGKLGILLALPAGQTLAPGEVTLLNLEFIANGGEAEVTTRLGFDDQIMQREVANSQAIALGSLTFRDASITLSGHASAQVSAASFVGSQVASASIISAFGTHLATMNQAATTLPLLLTLGGTRVTIRDSAGSEFAAPLFFVSPNQVNYLLPADVAEGLATVTITNAAGTVARGLLKVERVAPGIFTADASGKGYAAADVQIRSDSSERYERVARYDPTTKQFAANPIRLLPNESAFLILYGTGWRKRSDLAAVQARIGGFATEVLYAGPQGDYAGLDQLNLRLPPNLIGRGDITVELEIDGQPTNPVKISIQ